MVSDGRSFLTELQTVLKIFPTVTILNLLYQPNAQY